MLRVAWVRGNYLNNFEGQNYVFDRKKIQLTGIAAHQSIHQRLPFPVIHLKSLMDMYNLPILKNNTFYQKIMKYIANRIVGDSQLLFGLERLQNEFDIFHTADPHYYYSYQLACLRRDHKINHLVVTCWETLSFNNETVRMKKKHKHFVLKYADHFIVYTQKAADVLVNEGVNPEKISKVHLGVDIQRFKPVKSKSLTSTITILFVGRLVEEKGIWDVYNAFKKLYSRNKKVILRIVGSGYLEKALLKRIEQDNLMSVVIIQHADYEEMPSIYQQADIFLMPSKTTSTWEEQYGMVLVEALASGLAVVAYNSGVIKEVMGDAGIVVKEGDVNGLQNELEKLIKNRNLRYLLSVKARDLVERNLDSAKTAKKIGTIYQHVISNSSYQK